MFYEIYLYVQLVQDSKYDNFIYIYFDFIIFQTVWCLFSHQVDCARSLGVNFTIDSLLFY